MGFFDFWKKLFNPVKKRKISRKSEKKSSKRTKFKTKKAKHKKPLRKVKRVKKKVRKPRKKTKRIYKKPIRKVKKVSRRPKKEGEREIGIITHYFGKISVGVIKLKKPLKIGERIHIKGAHDDFVQTITSMQLNHKGISYAPKGAEVGIKVIQKVHPNDRVYKVEERLPQ